MHADYFVSVELIGIDKFINNLIIESIMTISPIGVENELLTSGPQSGGDEEVWFNGPDDPRFLNTITIAYNGISRLRTEVTARELELWGLTMAGLRGIAPTHLTATEGSNKVEAEWSFSVSKEVEELYSDRLTVSSVATLPDGDPKAEELRTAIYHATAQPELKWRQARKHGPYGVTAVPVEDRRYVYPRDGLLLGITDVLPDYIDEITMGFFKGIGYRCIRKPNPNQDYIDTLGLNGQKYDYDVRHMTRSEAKRLWDDGVSTLGGCIRFLMKQYVEDPREWAEERFEVPTRVLGASKPNEFHNKRYKFMKAER
ncbi:MAG: hypothetical protein JWL85_147 [Candidatus Saccharibacteria bacterium]|nr:hypothetical protein [Candidatus Saccharibacteria bacterium]